MKKLKSWFVSIAFGLAGVAIDASASAQSRSLDRGVCSQLAPLGGKGKSPALVENGFSRTPLGMRLENPQSDAYEQWLSGFGAYSAVIVTA